jgi:hypothetical protein
VTLRLERLTIKRTGHSATITETYSDGTSWDVGTYPVVASQRHADGGTRYVLATADRYWAVVARKGRFHGSMMVPKEKARAEWIYEGRS